MTEEDNDAERRVRARVEGRAGASRGGRREINVMSRVTAMSSPGQRVQAALETAQNELLNIPPLAADATPRTVQKRKRLCANTRRVLGEISDVLKNTEGVEDSEGNDPEVHTS